MDEDLNQKLSRISAEAMVQFGVDTQIIIWIEEMSELTKELCKELNGRVKDVGQLNDNIREEVADVYICMCQALALFGPELVIEKIRKKTIRLEKIIEEAKKT